MTNLEFGGVTWISDGNIQREGEKMIPTFDGRLDITCKYFQIG